MCFIVIGFDLYVFLWLLFNVLTLMLTFNEFNL
jgi:hypothetical protein